METKEAARLPKPPSVPKPTLQASKGRGPRGEDLSFESYNLAHPILLEEVTNMVNSGMAHIVKEKERHENARAALGNAHDPVFEDKLQSDRHATYRSAFLHYIESSTLYKPFLRGVLSAFDDTNVRLSQKLREYSTSEMDKRIAQNEHSTALQDQELSYSKLVEEKVNMVVALQKKLAAKEVDVTNMQVVAQDLRQKAVQAAEEWEEMRASTSLLTKSLLRYESQNKELKRKEADNINENVKLTISEKKANNDAEGLRLKNQELEQENRALVSHEEMEKKTQELENTQMALRHRDDQYKDLMQRYSLLKSTIENTYKKQLPFYAKKTIETATATADYGVISRKDGIQKSSTNANNLQLPSSTTLEIIDRNHGDIRATVEVLLDLVRQLQKRKAQRGGHELDDLINQDQGDAPALTDLDADWDGLDGSQKREAQPLLEENTSDGWPAADDAATARNTSRETASFEATETAANFEPTDTCAEAAASDTIGIYKQLDRTAPAASLFAHFNSLGDDINIPNYLRITGRVQNMFFSRKDTGRLIHAVMQSARGRRELLHRKLNQVSQAGYTSKSATDFTVGQIYELLSQPFSIYFESFLRKRFHTDARVVQVAFNLLETAKKYIAESDCRLFLLILNDDLPEDVWYAQDDTFREIMKTMKKKESKSSHFNEGIRQLTVDEFMRTLKASFPHKGESSFKKLQRALALENKSSRFIVSIPSLLVEEEGEAPTTGGTGLRGMFCELLRFQYVTETIQLYEKVSSCIDVACKVPKSQISANMISYNHLKAPIQEVVKAETNVTTLRRALLDSDDTYLRSEVNGYIARGLGVTLEKALLMEAKKDTVYVSDFKLRLRMGILKRATAQKD